MVEILVSENKKNIERPAVYIGPNINPPFAHWNPATHRSYPGNKNRFAIRKRKQWVFPNLHVNIWI